MESCRVCFGKNVKTVYPIRNEFWRGEPFKMAEAGDFKSIELECLCHIRIIRVSRPNFAKPSGKLVSDCTAASVMDRITWNDEGTSW